MGRAEGRPISLGTPLEKSLTGIKGLDEITKGGLPKDDRHWFVEAPGPGRHLLAAEFLVEELYNLASPAFLCLSKRPAMN